MISPLQASHLALRGAVQRRMPVITETWCCLPELFRGLARWPRLDEILLDTATQLHGHADIEWANLGRDRRGPRCRYRSDSLVAREIVERLVSHHPGMHFRDASGQPIAVRSLSTEQGFTRLLGVAFQPLEMLDPEWRHDQLRRAERLYRLSIERDDDHAAAFASRQALHIARAQDVSRMLTCLTGLVAFLGENGSHQLQLDPIDLARNTGLDISDPDEVIRELAALLHLAMSLTVYGFVLPPDNWEFQIVAVDPAIRRAYWHAGSVVLELSPLAQPLIETFLLG